MGHDHEASIAFERDLVHGNEVQCKNKVYW